jgi:hypothetical protein
MKITSNLTNLTSEILILTVQMFFEYTLKLLTVRANQPLLDKICKSQPALIPYLFEGTVSICEFCPLKNHRRSDK